MYLLDTSALLIHCLREPGAHQVGKLLHTAKAYVCAASWLELGTRLRDFEERQRILDAYQKALAGTVDVTEQVAFLALSLRPASQARVPSIDALIAACAKSKSYTLVHRDAHLASIPDKWVKQLMLPYR